MCIVKKQCYKFRIINLCWTLQDSSFIVIIRWQHVVLLFLKWFYDIITKIVLAEQANTDNKTKQKQEKGKHKRN